jgi:DNA-binding HxlR family transcriptional regulator
MQRRSPREPAVPRHDVPRGLSRMRPPDDRPLPAPRRTASPAKRTVVATLEDRPACCPYYHQAIELIGRRWTGAIVGVLIHRQALRFGEIAEAVPELSDRLLSERMKELERHGVVVRTVRQGRPVRVEYELTEMGRDLAPAVHELERWARRWLA